MEIQELRELMVDRQLAARGVSSEAVLAAMRRVPREAFVPDALAEFAYEDAALPIEAQQTISQPYMVGFMTEALGLGGGERVLEIGTGSGYAAAVLAEIAEQVFTVERHRSLADSARERLRACGYENVTVLEGDGSKGHPQAAPYDAIMVTAGGPQVPHALRAQLKVGGRLVIPVGPAERIQSLIRITRTGPDRYEEEDLGGVRFVPLIGQEAWPDPAGAAAERVGLRLHEAVAQACEEFGDVGDADLAPLLSRIGEARVVLIGEASHGTSEFYRMRARITQELIRQKGFNIVAIEADWPDAARIDAWVRRRSEDPKDWSAFARFPTWMWRNEETRGFVDWLYEQNDGVRDPGRMTAFYGLDIYSLHTSIGAVLDYLDDVDPDAAHVARERYACLTPWQRDPAAYGRAALSEGFTRCGEAVAAMLHDLLAKRMQYEERDGARLFDAEQNMRLIASAEEYYRIMYGGGADSWNLRDKHMFDTLQRLLAQHGPQARAVVWAHNSHIGDAAATQMSARGEYNIGQLCRDHFGPGSYHIGFGTHSGTVAAANDWGAPMQVMQVRPSHPESYERLCHEAGVSRFMLRLRGAGEDLRRRLAEPRLERAIGVIYRPDTERFSHYFEAVLPAQFDEYIWLDESQAVAPLSAAALKGVPETYPFGL